MNLYRDCVNWISGVTSEPMNSDDVLIVAAYNGLEADREDARTETFEFRSFWFVCIRTDGTIRRSTHTIRHGHFAHSRSRRSQNVCVRGRTIYVCCCNGHGVSGLRLSTSVHYKIVILLWTKLNANMTTTMTTFSKTKNWIENRNGEALTLAAILTG